ncbi:MAG: 50S rRNA methyltransferase, partial [Chlamydiae bacterium]|nr:50S rRNA methyltransferase [Chlamydiota bacterium]
GGAEGIPRNLIEKVPKLSLSKLTWSHQTTRLLLLEQIYRAYTLHEGINYHK